MSLAPGERLARSRVSRVVAVSIVLAAMCVSLLGLAAASPARPARLLQVLARRRGKVTLVMSAIVLSVPSMSC